VGEPGGFREEKGGTSVRVAAGVWANMLGQRTSGEGTLDRELNASFPDERGSGQMGEKEFRESKGSALLAYPRPSRVHAK